jgi:predicted dithiol-disulfide oxidoreductase (DUF899 family)
MLAMTDKIENSAHSPQHLQFPGESAAYRAARNALLDEEMALRRQIEHVSAQRRTLPMGGPVREDYVFEALGADGRPGPLKLSELFAPNKNSLALYSFMYGPERKRPCPGCTHFLDSLDGVARHASQGINLSRRSRGCSPSRASADGLTSRSFARQATPTIATISAIHSA